MARPISVLEVEFDAGRITSEQYAMERAAYLGLPPVVPRPGQEPVSCSAPPPPPVYSPAYAAPDVEAPEEPSQLFGALSRMSGASAAGSRFDYAADTQQANPLVQYQVLEQEYQTGEDSGEEEPAPGRSWKRRLPCLIGVAIAAVVIIANIGGFS